MSKRFAWLLGVLGMVAIGLLVACGSKYSASSDGLVIVGSQGSAVIQSFTFGLSNGHISAVSNPPATSGQPSAMVLDPAGAFAYVLIDQNSIAAFKVNSNGTTTATGTSQTFGQTSQTVVVPVTECDPLNPVPVSIPVTVPVFPVAMTLDSAGKYLFVANVSTGTTAPVNYTCNSQPITKTVSIPVPGTVSVFSIGGNASLSEVLGSPFAVPVNGTTASLVGLAVTPTVFPAANSVCSPPNSPTVSGQYLYALDSLGQQVWEFAVDSSSGALGNPGQYTSIPSFAADQVPAGIVVDPCNRFVYVSDSGSNKVSAYSICNGTATQSPTCPTAPDGSLVPVAGSPFSLAGGANGPGPMVVDPFGNYLYIVDTLSNQVSAEHISPALGSLTAASPAIVATGSQPKAIAIRSDDNWLFVTNYQAATLSQYAITPASGALSPQPATTTDNYPWGVAVK